MRIRIVIVEDEFPVLMDISRKIKNLGYDLVGAHISYEEALVSIIENEPDLLILDINLGGKKSGIDLAENINKKFKIPFLFLTASSDARTFEQASKVSPMGFIIKPFKLEDLRNNIELAYQNYQKLKSVEHSDEFKKKDEHYFIKQNGASVNLNVDELTHIEAMDNYIKLYCDKNKYTINMSLKDICFKLPQDKFIRIHKSTAVALNAIQSIEGNTLYLTNGISLNIGKTYRDGLLSSITLL